MLSSKYFSKLLPLFFIAFGVVLAAQAKSIDLPVIPNTLSPNANTFSISSENYNQGVGSHCPKITATHNPYIMHSQAEVDVFKDKQYEKCTSVPYLWISGNDIRNLDALSNITLITGGQQKKGYALYIGKTPGESDKDYSNNQLKVLNGLDHLTNVHGSIYINENPALKKMSILSKLEAVDGDIFIGNNPKLRVANIFDNLTKVESDFTIVNNPKADFRLSFVNIGTIGGSLRLVKQPFYRAPLFIALSSIHRRFYVSETAILTFTDFGFNALSNIDGPIDIYNNNELVSLKGLENIQELGDDNQDNLYDLLIDKNPKLTNCSQLYQVYDPSKESRYYFSSTARDLPKTCKTSFEGKSDYYKSAFIQ